MRDCRGLARRGRTDVKSKEVNGSVDVTFLGSSPLAALRLACNVVCRKPQPQLWFTTWCTLDRRRADSRAATWLCCGCVTCARAYMGQVLSVVSGRHDSHSVCPDLSFAHVNTSLITWLMATPGRRSPLAAGVSGPSIHSRNGSDARQLNN